MECAAGVRVVAEEFRRALRAEFDAPEKIGLRPGETVEPGWPEMGGGTENLRVRREADGGAAPVRRCAQLLQAAGRMPARKALAEQFLGRKSGVKGKSVSLSEDPGGCLHI